MSNNWFWECRCRQPIHIDRTVSKIDILGGAASYASAFQGLALGGGGMWKSKAMQAAAEELIIDIIEYMIKTNPSLTNHSNTLSNSANDNNVNAQNSPSSFDGTTVQNNQVTISVRRITYPELQKMVKYLESNSQIQNVEKKLEDKTATITVTTNLPTDKIADYILANNIGLKLSIEKLSENNIGIKVK